MTRLLLVRHGQTEWNHTARYQGHIDIHLSDEGRRQAEQLSHRLAKEKLDAVYASDLSRARETAAILARPHKLQVQEIAALREINFGLWEGLTYREIMASYRDLAERWHTSPATVQIPEGECFEQVKDRSYRAILELQQKHEPGTIAVVTHGGTIRAIICALLGLDLNMAFRLKQDNCALNVIEFYDGYGILCLMNDSQHLAGL